MKKLLALLLVLCTVIGLVACGNKPADNTGATGPSTNGPTVDPNAPFAGKSLQIWGLGTKDDYTDYSTFGKGNYLWMMKAAIEEWAAINGVTIEWKGGYNQNQLLAAMASGNKPDIIFQSNEFPAAANYGILGAFTKEERDALAEICGDGWLDAMIYRGNSHGFLVPWVGCSMLYYNKSMFERYDVKTPKEYFMEGNWTWTTFTKVCEEMTRDVDADGTIDTYGLPADSAIGAPAPHEDEKGKLISPFEDQYDFLYDCLQWRYENITVKQTVLSPGRNQIQKNVTYPMYAMQNSDCEPYNFEHCYQTLSNGDELEVVPSPRYDGKAAANMSPTVNYTQSAMSLVSSCDEREASVDLMKYVLKCGLKYISDFSLGTVKCDYEGIQGSCDLSKTWKEEFAKVCEQRQEDFANIEFDQALADKITEYHNTCKWTIFKPYAGVTAIHQYKEATQMPPASSIPAIQAKYEAAIQKYNDLYIFD